jgi:MYXO-CTERM domain-containing protein
MLRFGPLLLLAWSALATPAGATCPYPPEVSTRTTATVVSQISSGPQYGHPARSQASVLDAVEGINVYASGVMVIDNGGFSAFSHAGGNLTIHEFSSLGGGANSLGVITDCLTFSGTTGTARAHIPIALTGDAAISWSIGGSYMPPETLDPASARLTINCAAASYDPFTISGCDDFDLVIDASADVDQTIELVFQFTFDVPITIQLSAIVGTGVGYAANGSPGALAGAATFDVAGTTLPMYITDIFAGGNPEVTLSATSGYDWFHPTPEPGGTALAGVLALALMRGKRRRPRTCSRSPCCSQSHSRALRRAPTAAIPRT